VEIEIVSTYPAKSSSRYPVTQEQIDDILDNELKGLVFPVKPVYNSRIQANGVTKGEFYSWGQLKQIRSIEIGKQDSPSREFLTDTLLHEYFEAVVMEKQYTEDFYRRLSRAGDTKRHKWIDAQIAQFLRKMEVDDGLV
jgi:hypothetical protein